MKLLVLGIDLRVQLPDGKAMASWKCRLDAKPTRPQTCIHGHDHHASRHHHRTSSIISAQYRQLKYNV